MNDKNVNAEVFAADLIMLMKRCNVKSIKARDDEFIISSKGYGLINKSIITYYKEDEDQ